MEFRPHSYQKEAIDFLFGRKYAILLMEEGLVLLLIFSDFKLLWLPVTELTDIMT